MDLVYIIIVNYNGYLDTMECLNSVFKNSYKNYKVVVCDNGSSNKSVDKIIQWENDNPENKIKLIESKINVGFSGGNNIGIKYALSHGADYVWLLNNDTIIKEDSLELLVKKIKEDTTIGICGSRLMYYDRPDEIQGLAGGYNQFFGRGWHIIHYNQLDRMKYIIGASMLIKKGVFESVGFLSETYFLYFEEIDLAERIKGKYRMEIALDSVVYHKAGASTGGGTELAFYYSFRNSIKFTWRYYRVYFPLVLIFTFFRIICPWKKRPYSRWNMCFKVVSGLCLKKVVR